MSKLHFIGGEKGGVGKSLVARILAQYLIDHETPFLGFDTDQSHGALLRFYRDYASPVAIDRYPIFNKIRADFPVLPSPTPCQPSKTVGFWLISKCSDIQLYVRR
jgi:cellulose biosynthesis protein BcsQ